jgi:iron complex outermembrane receptor protein
MKKSVVVGLALFSGVVGFTQGNSGGAYELSPIRVLAGDALEDSGAPTSSFTTGAVDLYQMGSVQETSALVPNLFVSSSETRGFGDTITMRGMGNTLFFSPAGVALYVDDVPSGDVFTYSSELLSGNALTVHRGGMGSFFGRNGPAGVIEIQSQEPGQEQRIELSAEVGSFDKRAFRANVSGPLADSGVSHSLTVFHNERGGYMYNATLGRDTDTREAQGAQWSLFFKPGNSWDARLKLVTESIDDGSQRLSSLFSPDPFMVGSDLEGETQMERNQVSFHMDRQFSWGQFKSITALQNWELDPSTVDLDLSPSPISTSNIFQDQELLTQEFRFESTDADNSIEWRAGLFFQEKETTGDSTRVFPAPPYFPVFTEQTTFEVEESQIAAFGHIVFKASEAFSIDAGLRIQSTDTSIDRLKVSPVGAAPIVANRDATYFSPDAGFRYQMSDQFSFFGRTSLSIKPKGYSAFTDILGLAAFEDESARSNELGFEYATTDDVFSARVTAFDISIDDYQLERSVPQATDYIVINADEVSSSGLEAEMVWKPMPQFELEAGIGTNDVTFDKHVDPFTNAVLNGLEVPFTPEYTVRGSARYRFDNGVFLQGTFRSIGETFFDESNSAMFRQGSYEVYDVQVGYRTDKYSVVVFGKNLGDERYYTFINPQIFAATPGDPETFGIRLDTRF